MPLWESQIETWLAATPERTAPADFDAFWDETQSLAQSQPLNPEITAVDYPSKKLSAYEISFDAFDRGPYAGMASRADCGPIGKTSRAHPLARLPRFSGAYLYTPDLGTSGIRRACARYPRPWRFLRPNTLLVGQQQRLFRTRDSGPARILFARMHCRWTPSGAASQRSRGG